MGGIAPFTVCFFGHHDAALLAGARNSNTLEGRRPTRRGITGEIGTNWEWSGSDCALNPNESDQ